MDSNEYNGWTNRATWVVNLHYGDSEEWLQEMVENAEGDVDKLADYLREEISNQVQEAIGDNMFLSDLINLNDINWGELANAYNDSFWEEDEEETEEEE
jgi:hypothetical protein